MTKHMPARRLLRAKQGGACCYCGDTMIPFNGKGGKMPVDGWPPKMETLEHLRRRGDGGRSNYDNLALACYECNSGRGSVDWLTYKSLKMGELQVAA